MLKEEAQRYSHELRGRQIPVQQKDFPRMLSGTTYSLFITHFWCWFFFRCVNIKPCKSWVVCTFSALLDFYTLLLFLYTYFSSPLSCGFLEGIVYISFKFNSQRLVQGWGHSRCLVNMWVFWEDGKNSARPVWDPSSRFLVSQDPPNCWLL